MRIWAVNPGYLNRQSLLGEHRELHAVVSILVNNKKGYSRHPETLRWRGFGWALSQRHELLAAEMDLRGYKDRSPVRLKKRHRKWPDVFVDRPAVQLSILSGRYENAEPGRIPLPASVQQLWAQHQYSVMARDDAEHKCLGGWIASRKSGKGIPEIYPKLVSLLRCPPRERNLSDTVRQMWNYVCSYLALSEKADEGQTTRNLLSRIQRLVLLHNIEFLKESTALGELPAWKG